jgi:glycosyltransferase involved in cell wall biosynthesis
LKLIFLADGDPLDVRTWSGTPFHMIRALQAEFPSGIAIRTPPSITYRVVRRLVAWPSNSVELGWLTIGASLKASPVLRTLKKIRPDLVVCIANTPVAAEVSSRYPIVHVSDTTFALMRNYYANFARLRPWVQQSGNAMERLVITRSRACLYSSQWAADSAVRDYGANPQRVYFVPWGCNVEFGRPEDFANRSGPAAPCPIVFIGVDWKRKGGDIALATVARLRNAGVQAHLHVIGIKPDGAQDNDAVTWHGFISKATDEGIERLDSLLGAAAFLLLPTRQDCTPMVIAEANSRGIPAITTLTGGVGSIVSEGVNGYALPVPAGPEAYAELIANIWSNPRRYLALRQAARSHCEKKLNWKRWAACFKKIVTTLDL